MKKKNLLIITQKVDEKDDLLGFFIDWIREFSKYFEKINIITLARGDYNLPDNVFVYSLGKENNSLKISRIFRFYKLLFYLVPRSTGVFVHMSPIFVIISWPITFIFRKKIIFWYLHRSVTIKLRLAVIMCYRLVTAAKESLGIKNSKIIEFGHGINIDRFKCDRDWSNNELSIISVGRISPIKNFETLIKALSILREERINLSLNIIGRPIMRKDFEYEKYLKDLITKLGLEANISFRGFVPYTSISQCYKRADFCIGPLPRGGIDKAILEAMATGCITMTSNTAFEKYFGGYADKLIFTDSSDLASKLRNLFYQSGQEKMAISSFLYNSVKTKHNLTNLISNISRLY